MKVNVSGMAAARKKIKDAISKLQTSEMVTVGIHEDGGEHKGGISNAQVLAMNEFGTSTSPARPSLVPGADSGSAEYAQIIESAVANGEPPGVALDRVGLVAVGKVKKYMTNLKTPPNARSTVSAKKSSNPLINTGEMRSSINYKVVKKSSVDTEAGLNVS